MGGLPPTIKKFAAELGSAADFVGYVQNLELSQGRYNHRSIMRSKHITNFFSTSNGRRYLILKVGFAPILDFRHFFRAASIAFTGDLGGGFGGMSHRPGAPETTLLGGLAVELEQCSDETGVSDALSQIAKLNLRNLKLNSQLNSCFAREDLGSNRLGVSFGRSITAAEADRTPISFALWKFLQAYQPAAPADIAKVKMPGNLDVVIETLSALLVGTARGLLDLQIIRPAY